MALWFPVGTEEAFVVVFRPCSFRGEHLHQTGCSLIHAFQRCTLVEVLSYALQHPFVVVFRFLRLIGFALSLGWVEEVDVRMFLQGYLTCNGKRSRFLEIGEHFRRDTEVRHFSAFGMIAYAHGSLGSRRIGFAAQFSRCTSAARNNLLNDERLVTGIGKGEVETGCAVCLVDSAEVVGSGIPCKLLCISRRCSECSECHERIDNDFVHKLYLTANVMKALHRMQRAWMRGLLFTFYSVTLLL